MSAYVYIITNVTNTCLYIGVTTNIARRVHEHKSMVIPGFSAKYKLSKLVYLEEIEGIKAAIERETRLKKYSRRAKNRLIESFNPCWSDLAAPNRLL